MWLHKVRTFTSLSLWDVFRGHIGTVLSYGVINSLPRFTAGVLAILYTSVFSLGQYGLYGVLTSLTVVLGISLEFGIPQAAMRNFYEVRRSEAEAQIFLSSAVYGSALLGVCGLPLLGILLYCFWDLAGHGRLLFIPLLLTIALFERSCDVMGTICRAIERPIFFSLGNLVQALITILSAFVFVYILHGALAGALLALLLGRLGATLVYQFILVRKRVIVPFKIRWTDLKACLHFGLPLVPNRFATWGRQLGLRPLLAFLVPLSSLGLYSFASALASLPFIATAALDLALSPVYYRMRVDDPDEFGQKIVTLAKVITAAFFALWSLLILFCPEIILVLAGKHYAGAASCCALLLCAAYMSAQHQFFVRQILFLKRTWIISAVGIPCAALAIAATYLLAGRYGIYAAAWSAVAAETIMFVAMALAVRRYERMHYPLTAVLLLLCTLLAMATGIGYEARLTAGSIGLLVKFAVGGAAIVAAYLIGIRPHRAFIAAVTRGRVAPGR